MTVSTVVPPRPKCHFKFIDRNHSIEVPELRGHLEDLKIGDSHQWIPIGSCLAHFDCSIWLQVMDQLIHHPERNSTNILRADILSESSANPHEAEESSSIVIWRRIRPRRPNIDDDLLQKCSIIQEGNTDNALVLYIPMTSNGPPENGTQIPFYHPKVRAVAFRYCTREIDSAESEEQEKILGDLFLYIVPFAEDNNFNAARTPSHRLSRTALALLETQTQHSWGSRHNYQKRVEHDTLVPRDAYMDMYIKLKEKYASLIIKNWVEKTDPKKHVFEDLGIAAFLILLWNETYKLTGVEFSSFVDVGCGNGLLVFLLNAEGFKGFGFDLQERKSWAVWRNLPGKADLRKISLIAPRMEVENADLFPPGCFLIGNHADELTSWIPILAHTVQDCYGFANIPCCLYYLDGQSFSKTKYNIEEDELMKLLGVERGSQVFVETTKAFDRGPPVQNKGGVSTRNVAYLRYISHLHLQLGWHLEKEALRIPSTKNWTLVGRRRIWQSHPLHINKDDSIISETADKLREQVEERISNLISQNAAKWKARLPPPAAKVSQSLSH